MYSVKKIEINIFYTSISTTNDENPLAHSGGNPQIILD